MKRARPAEEDFQCSICGKTTTSDASLKRHIRYCRKRGGEPKSRTKSCQACVRAKTRCEPCIDGCVRCTDKGVSCSMNPFVLQNDLLLHTSLESTSNEPLAFASDGSFSAPSQAHGSFDALGGQFPFGLLAPLPDLPIELSSTLQLFESQAFQDPSTVMASTIGEGILRSYPDLMRDRKKFPSFIHPCCYGSESNGWALPKSLEEASLIANLFTNGQASAVDGIRQEQQRIDASVLEMDLESLLSSAQALIIYVLMRIASGPSDDQEDVHLLRTFMRICARIPSLPDFEDQMSKFSDWKRWIIVESKRRVNSVLRLMWRLYNLDVGSACPTVNSYGDMPLPASKLLWNATSEQEWLSELSKDDFYKKLSQQDLVNFRCGYRDGQPSREEWARWYSGTDELGILVVIYTSLL